MEEEAQVYHATRDPGPETPLRTALRWAWLPYSWGISLPAFSVSTIFWGTMAVVTSKLVDQRVGFHCGTIWAWAACKANLCRVKLTGRANADPKQSYVIMSNHQSSFDILAFYGAWGRQFRWVIKEELRSVPGLGWGCEAVGHIFIDRRDRQRALASLGAAKGQLVDGVSVMFFPEGRRSRDGRLGVFKKGGFMMALDLGLPILPVSISGSHRVMPGTTFKPLPGTIRIHVHPPIDTSTYGTEGRDRLMADVRARIASGLSPWERGMAPYC